MRSDGMAGRYAQPWGQLGLILTGYLLFFLWSLYFYMGDTGHVVIWLSAGFLTGFLIRVPVRSWIALSFGAFVAESAILAAVAPLPVPAILYYASWHILTSVAAAGLYRRLSTSRNGFHSLGDFGFFVLATVVITPLASAWIGKVLSPVLPGQSDSWLDFWIDTVSVMTGMVFVAPPVMYGGQLMNLARRAYRSRPYWIHLFTLCAAVLILVALDSVSTPGDYGFWGIVLLSLVATTVSATLFGMWGSLTTTSVMVFVGAHLARIESGALEVMATEQAMALLMQIVFLAGGLLATYALAVVVENLSSQRDRANGSAAHLEELFQAVPVGLWELDLSSVKSWLDEQPFPRREDCRPFLERNVDELRSRILACPSRANAALAALYGFPTLAMLESSQPRLLASSPDEFLVDVWSRAYAGESDIQMVRDRVLENGSTVSLQIHHHVPEPSRPSWSRWLVIVHDVSDLKAHSRQVSLLSEETARLSNLLLETEKIARIGSWYWDFKTGDITWSPGMYALNEIPTDTPLTLSDSLRRVHPSDKVWLQRTFEQGVTDHRTRFRLLLPDNRVRWIESVGAAVEGPDGQTTGLRGFQVDVTDLVLLEEENGGIANILESTSVVAYVADELSRNRLRYVSSGAGRFGWVWEDLLPEGHSLFAHIDPAHRDAVDQHLQALTPKLGHLPIDYPMETPVGKVWFRDFVRRQASGPDGRPVFEGVLIDISSEMEAKALRQVEERRRKALHDLVMLQEVSTEKEFLQEALALAETLTESRISFLHFVNEDQTLDLAAWSRRTQESYCHASYLSHYPIADAGIWADAYRVRGPVVVNCYNEYPDRKGLPEGHAHLDRLISIPVMEDGQVVVLAGVGNADRDYTEEDVLSFQLLCNEIWRLVGASRRKKTREEERARLKAFFDATYDSFVIYEPADDGITFRVTYMNRAAEEIGGVPVADALGRDFRLVWPGVESSGLYDIIRNVSMSGEPHVERELHYVHEDVDQWHDLSAMRQPDGTVAVAFRDSTDVVNARNESIRLERELTASQRMEALGRLAGGVAHDFNNLLGVILGHAEAGQFSTDDPAQLKRHLAQIEHAAIRSAEMTRHLLGFARRQVGQLSHMNLAEYLDTLMSMLRRLIGENISLDFVAQEKAAIVDIDPTFVDQIITNLCVNSRDAISGPGRIEIKLEKVEKTAVESAWPEECVLDTYLCLSVTDTGHGIDPVLLPHVFDPFFSTKESGTGLGLSTVYGIVRQLVGHIDILSTVGKGTTVRIFLPPAPNQSSPADS